MTAATILVADDDSAIRTVLHQALARAGYNVRTTGTAAGLWKMIAAGEGNVAITDVMLPDESGFDLIPRIKRLRPELPVLVMSAQNTLLTAITAAERGAFEYLPKPFDLNELTRAVSEALSNTVVHAYRNTGGRVEVRASVDAAAGVIAIGVRDYGIGCNPRTDSPGIGMGVPLMTALARTVNVAAPTDGGTDVCLTFALPAT